MIGNVMNGCRQLDHVLVAGKHEGLFRNFLKTSASMLRIPLIGNRLAFAPIGVGPETNFDHSHTMSLNSGKTFDWPWKLVVQSRLPVRQQFPSESLHHAGFIRAQSINTAE